MTQTDATGTVFTKVPPTTFPIDSKGRSMFTRDAQAHYAGAIANRLSIWMAGRGEMPMDFDPSGASPELFTTVKLQSFDGGSAYGLKWSDQRGSGHLPGTFKKVGSTRVAVPESTVPSAPVSRSATETVGVQTERSAIVNGRIRIGVIRPAPEWCPSEEGAAAEPARRYWPPLKSRSTATLTVSHVASTRCHSSMRIGLVPCSAVLGSAPAVARGPGSPRSWTVRARLVAVAVLPTAFGPSSRMAGSWGSNSSSNSSTILRT